MGESQDGRTMIKRSTTLIPPFIANNNPNNLILLRSRRQKAVCWYGIKECNGEWNQGYVLGVRHNRGMSYIAGKWKEQRWALTPLKFVCFWPFALSSTSEGLELTRRPDLCYPWSGPKCPVTQAPITRTIKILPSIGWMSVGVFCVEQFNK